MKENEKARRIKMSEETETRTWNPPRSIEELYEKAGGHRWSSINAPTAGPRDEKELIMGNAPLQLYSLATPNGHKVGILLEELEIDYDANVVNIFHDEQFSYGFCELNPNSKIPAFLDKNGPDGMPIRIFESNSILAYLGKKYCRHGYEFIPKDTRLRVECTNWMYWQASCQGPFTGQFWHFMNYAPPEKCEAREYGVVRYGMEVQRLCSVLDQHLKDKTYMLGDYYSVADMSCFPWFHALCGETTTTSGVKISEFLGMDKYKHARAWAERIAERSAVHRGLQVCSGGIGKPWLEESEKP